MKRPNSRTLIRAVCTGVLFFLGTAVPAIAEQKQNDENANRELQARDLLERHGQAD